MYIYLQYHGKYTKDVGTTVYIFSISFFFFLLSPFKTFDSCIYVTEVSFHWFLSYGHTLAFHARESEGRSTLGKLLHNDLRREKLAKTYAPYRASFSQKSTSAELRASEKLIVSYQTLHFISREIRVGIAVHISCNRDKYFFMRVMLCEYREEVPKLDTIERATELYRITFVKKLVS